MKAFSQDDVMRTLSARKGGSVGVPWSLCTSTEASPEGIPDRPEGATSEPTTRGFSGGLFILL